MTNRELQIAKAILDVLHDLDGGQVGALPLHAEVNLSRPCTSVEFDGALTLCDRKRWVNGLPTKFHGTKWNINDAGEAARLQMQ